MKRTLLTLALVAALASGALAQAGSVSYPSPTGVHPPVGNYSHVAVVEGRVKTLYLAGQVGIRLDGGIDSTDAIAQYIQALRNVDSILKSNGASWEHVVKWTAYLVTPLEPARLAELRRVRAELMAGRKAPMPASTLVYVKALAGPQYLVEIDVTAVIPQ